MKIILPVAGKGTRLRPHTHTHAKSLVKVAGKTVLEHIITSLSVLDVDEYIFITDENGRQIRRFMEEVFPQLNCHYIVQNERKGPAHAVYLAAHRIQPGDDVLVVFNDTIFVTDLHRIETLCADCDGLIYSHEVEDYQRFGVNVLRDSFIVEMVEKPDTPVSRLAQVGLYYLKDGAGFMSYIGAAIDAGDVVKGEYYLPAVFMRMIEDGHKFRAPEIEAWLDCGKPETLLETNRYLLDKNHACFGSVENTVIIEPVYIAEGAVIRDSVVGPHVTIAEGCVVERSLLRDCIINRETDVKEMNCHNCIVGESVALLGTPRTLNVGDHSLLKMS